MTKPASAIIIGGGHNGLVCGAYLAKAGFNVQILEARSIIGGGLSPINFAQHYGAPGLVNAAYGLNAKICQDLSIDSVDALSSKQTATISLNRDGHHLILGADEVSGGNLSESDIDSYRQFKKEFLAYAEALQPLMMNKPPRLKDMDKKDKKTLVKLGWSLRFGLGTKSMREFLRVGGINIYDVLNEIFDSPALKGAISVDAVMGQHMGPRTPNTVLTYLQRLWAETHSKQSCASTQQISQSLERAAIEAGVQIRTGTKVSKILVNNSRSIGVELETGEQLGGDIIVSNTDARTTFLNLVGPPNLDAMFCHRVSSVRQKGDVAKLYFAVSRLPNISGLSREQLSQRLVIAPDMRYVEHAFNHSKYGEYSPNPVLDMSISSLDNFEDQVHVVSVSASFAPYKLKEGWDAHRDGFEESVINTIEQYSPEFSSSILASELLTPEDIEKQYNISGGHWHHGELSIDQSFMMRPVHGSSQYDTPIDGLYLCGAGTHPGGGITGVPGHNAAQRIIGLLKGGA